MSDGMLSLSNEVDGRSMELRLTRKQHLAAFVARATASLWVPYYSCTLT